MSMLVSTKAEALIAVDIIAVWGVQAKNNDFINRDVNEALDGFKLGNGEKYQLEKAICDNLEAYRNWSNRSIDEHNSATRWSLYRPTPLNPVRYKIGVVSVA